VVDANNFPGTGAQRNHITNPFGVTSLTGIGGNTFNDLGGEWDLAFKADEGCLFTTRFQQLVEVNQLTNVLTPINNYAGRIEMRGIAAVPEPGTLIALGAGLLALARRRRRA